MDDQVHMYLYHVYRPIYSPALHTYIYLFYVFIYLFTVIYIAHFP